MGNVVNPSVIQSQTKSPYNPDWRPGDLGWAHRGGLLPAAIRFAERRDGEDSQWSHVFALDRFEDGVWYVVQADSRGVSNSCKLDEVAPGGRYEIVTFPDEQADRSKFLEFMRAEIGDRYSWLTILSCAIDMALPDVICLRRAQTWICSGLLAAALTYAGYSPLINLPDLYTTTPSEIRKKFPAK